MSLQKYCRQDTGSPHPKSSCPNKHKAGKAANQHNRAKIRIIRRPRGPGFSNKELAELGFYPAVFTERFN